MPVARAHIHGAERDMSGRLLGWVPRRACAPGRRGGIKGYIGGGAALSLRTSGRAGHGEAASAAAAPSACRKRI